MPEHGPHAAARAPSARGHPFDRTRHSLTDPTSIWVIVNKTPPDPPLDFHPQIALVRGYQVATAAARPAHPSARHRRPGRRTPQDRQRLPVLRLPGGCPRPPRRDAGLQAADAISAAPGYSEHQTGLAVDLQPLDGTCALDPCFVRTPAGRWLAAHAWTFGFVLRYTEANRRVTGYSPEPWHVRYVGASLARELHATGTGSLETFFGVRGGGYPAG